MKILCLTPWYPAHAHDQSGNYILDSLQALKADGHSQRIIVVKPWKPRLSTPTVFKGDFDVQTVRYCSIPRHFLRALSNWLCLRRVIPLLEKEIRQNRPDIIHAHTELYAIAAVQVGIKFNIPTVVTIHGIETSSRYWQGAKRAIVRALNRVDRVILVGEPLRAYFKALIGRDDHFSIIYNGFRMAATLFQRCIESWPRHLKIISVSNLHEGKGIDLNLQALAKLRDDGFIHWHYTIVGDGRERASLTALVKTLALETQVSFLGACRHDVVYEQLNKAHVFSLPSYREAFGIAYLEAMAAGLLTIGVKGQGPIAFIEEGVSGLLIEPMDVDSLADAFKMVFTEQNRMQLIAQTGQAFIQKNFTWAAHAKSLTACYQTLLPDKRVG